MRLYLLRHGDTGRSGHMDGRTDHPLTPKGWQQMERQTSGLNWSRIVTSPLMRAQAPATTLARRAGARLVVDPDWSELDFGLWDGRLRADIEEDPEARQRLANFYSDPIAPGPPGGETWGDLQTRVARAVQSLLSEASAENTLVIAHGGSIRAALVAILALPLQTSWAVQIAHGTRLTLEAGLDDRGRPWGQLLEIAQP
jgi:alpha-ribazole phosphatase